MDYLLKEIDVFVKIIDLGSFKAAAEELKSHAVGNDTATQAA